MENLFRRQELQSQLDQDGCVVVPFLEPAELAALREFYYSLHPDGMAPQMRDGIHMTIWCSDRTYKDQIREGLQQILGAAARRLYQDFRLVSPVFIVKRKGLIPRFRSIRIGMWSMKRSTAPLICGFRCMMSMKAMVRCGS